MPWVGLAEVGDVEGLTSIEAEKMTSCTLFSCRMGLQKIE